MKRLSRFFFINMLFVFISCAPKPKIVTPPLYKEEFSLEEIILKTSRNIEVLKAIADIKIEKNNKLYDIVKASVLVKKPDWVHMRIYKFGMLIKNFVIKDKKLYVLSGKGNKNLKKLGNELYNAIFWWDDIGRGIMSRRGDVYIIRTENKEIHLDRATLLPVKQEIKALDKNIFITYDKPVNNEEFWYPSVLKISIDHFIFTVKLKKLLKNPALGQFDFWIPDQVRNSE